MTRTVIVDNIRTVTTQGVGIPGAAGGVESVYGRSGVVVANADDYTASEVTNVPSGNLAANDIQAAVNELQTEIDPLSVDSHPHSNLAVLDATTASYTIAEETLAASALQDITAESIGDLSDVDITGIEIAEVLTWNGSQLVNSVVVDSGDRSAVPFTDPAPSVITTEMDVASHLIFTLTSANTQVLPLTSVGGRSLWITNSNTSTADLTITTAGSVITSHVIKPGENLHFTDDGFIWAIEQKFANQTVLENTTASYTTTEETKLAGIESSATADQTNAEIKTAYEANANTEVFTTPEQTKLGGIEAAATADQTDAELKTGYENNADTNAFTDANVTTLGTALQESPVSPNAIILLWTGTQAQYDAIGTKVSTTLYFVTA